MEKYKKISIKKDNTFKNISQYKNKILKKFNFYLKYKILNLFVKYLIIVFGIFLICYLIYFFKQKIFRGNNSKNNNKIIEQYIKEQNNFCNNPDKYINPKYEKDLFLIDIKLNELKYKMYFYKSFGWVLNGIKAFGAYEIPNCNYMAEALKFYALKKNILNNKDIFILDIGGNYGWYPSVFGRYGYTILSFEAFEKNNYIAKKNYCYLNKNSNVIIITKGLSSEEKKCNYFSEKNNAGNGIVICNNTNLFNNVKLRNRFAKEAEIELKN